MKKLYLIRHAKSGWGDLSLPDFERPLNERGKTDAPAMAKRLLSKNIQLDAFVSSPAKRARKTCTLFCKEFHINTDQIIFIDKLYLAAASIFFDVIRDLDDKYDQVALFAHNPGITDFVNQLCKDVRIDEMPTCSVFAVEIHIKKWEDFMATNNHFLFFDYPKA